MANGREIKAPQHLFDWMTSLADPTRLRLLGLLEHHELGVAELCEVLQLPQSTVSRHLKVLSERGWLRNRQQGTANLYRMARHQMPDPARELWVLSKQQSATWPALEQDRIRLSHHLDRRRTSEFFARAAHGWEQLREELHGSHFMRVVLASLLDPALVLVDLGCGTGELLQLLAPRVRHVVGVDRSQEMLQAASARVATHKNAQLVRADLAAIPLPSCVCDAATMILVLSYLPQPKAAIGELSRVLRPRGRAVVLTLLQHDRDDYRHKMGQTWLGFGPEQMKTMLSEARLDIDICEPLAPDLRFDGHGFRAGADGASGRATGTGRPSGPALLFISARRQAS